MPLKPDYRVTVIRHGGFAGVPMTFEAATASLPESRADELRRLVDACGHPPRTPEASPEPASRDLVLWSVRVRGEAVSWSVRGREDALDPAIARLIEAVRSLA